MFYRPHFCCHCGEKIIRAKWTPLTSRRFCEFCSIEQKQHDLIPRAAAVAVLLFGAAGLAAYITGGNSSREQTPSAKLRTIKGESEQAKPTNSARSGIANSIANNSPEPPSSDAAAANTLQRAPQRNSSTEPVYYCGAVTKKGTPCTRRVRTPGRCWQHLGQPAMSSLRNKPL
jgi:hypothetical protein